MKKPTIYLDTSFISAFWYDGADIAMLARRLRTREWWKSERRNFAVLSSAFCEVELRAGVFPRQAECVRMVRRLRYLNLTGATRALMKEIVRQGIVPANKPIDAAHLAIATIADIDYLLTWNYAHMANPVAQARLDQVCAEWELTAPLMVSPESIPQFRYGQSIHRRK